MNDRTEFLDDIRTTAFDGAINYWAVISGHKIKEYDDEGTVGWWIEITPDMVEKGIALVKYPSFKVREDILAAILLGDRNNDAGEIDAECADVIVQAAVFSKIVYG